jgi:type I restriction enzyme S subunit
MAGDNQPWPTVTLGEISTEFRNGLSAKPAAEPPGLPILRISGVRSGLVEFSDTRFHRGHERDAETYGLRNSDLLFIRYNGNPDLVAACGMVRSLPMVCVYPDKLIRVRLDSSRVMPAFVERAMLLPETRAQLGEVIKTAAGQYGISGKDLKEIRFPLPPLAEQRRIVARIEALFARTRRARADLERVEALANHGRAALLSAAFSGAMTEGWRREHGIADFESSRLDEVVSEFRYGTAQKCTEEPKGVAVLRIPNITAGRVDLTDLKYAEFSVNYLKKLSLSAGDILIVRSNGSPDLIGLPALVTEREAGLAYAGYLIRLRPQRTLVIPEFLAQMLLAPQIREVVVIGARSSSGVHNINVAELSALRVPVPSIMEQQEILKRLGISLEALRRASSDSRRALALLDHLEKSILTRAFRGELVPQDPNDEPAEAALARARPAPAQARPRSRSTRQPA